MFFLKIRYNRLTVKKKAKFIRTINLTQKLETGYLRLNSQKYAVKLRFFTALSVMSKTKSSGTLLMRCKPINFNKIFSAPKFRFK